MNFEDIILQYLKYDKQAMKDLLTLFLNAVLQRTKEVGAFTDASLVRLAVSILMDMDEEWITTRKYLNMDVEEDEEDEEDEKNAIIA